jgi:hypothetical protein
VAASRSVHRSESTGAGAREGSGIGRLGRMGTVVGAAAPAASAPSGRTAAGTAGPRGSTAAPARRPRAAGDPRGRADHATRRRAGVLAASARQRPGNMPAVRRIGVSRPARRGDDVRHRRSMSFGIRHTLPDLVATASRRLGRPPPAALPGGRAPGCGSGPGPGRVLGSRARRAGARRRRRIAWIDARDTMVRRGAPRAPDASLVPADRRP